MALDIVKLYISLISQFFALSDMVVMASPGGSNNTAPPLLPGNSNSFSTAHYLMKILGEVQETVNELNTMDISNEAASGLKSLLESAKWRFEDILINAWLRGPPFSPFQLPLHSSKLTPRRKHILLPRTLDRQRLRLLVDDLPHTDGAVPAARHHLRVQTCRRRRPRFDVHRQGDQAELHSRGLRLENHQGVLGCVIRVFGWSRTFGVGRISGRYGEDPGCGCVCDAACCGFESIGIARSFEWGASCLWHIILHATN